MARAWRLVLAALVAARPVAGAHEKYARHADDGAAVPVEDEERRREEVCAPPDAVAAAVEVDREACDKVSRRRQGRRADRHGLDAAPLRV